LLHVLLSTKTELRKDIKVLNNFFSAIFSLNLHPLSYKEEIPFKYEPDQHDDLKKN